MKTVRITAKTIEAAVAEGLKQLGISREEAVVHVVEQPSSGLFGLIHKKMAVVDISAPDEEVPAEEPKQEEAAPAEAPKEETEAKAPSAEETPAEEKTAEEAPKEAPAPKAEEMEKKGREDFVFKQEEQDKTAEEAKKFLASVFKGMHLDVTMECLMNEERILLNLHGEGWASSSESTARPGCAPVPHQPGSRQSFHHHYFVLLDVENYRERRKDTLEALARRLAAKVKRTGEPVKLEPMAAGERRIIHLALQDDGAVTTESEGEAPHRYVVIKRND